MTSAVWIVQILLGIIMLAVGLTKINFFLAHRHWSPETHGGSFVFKSFTLKSIIMTTFTDTIQNGLKNWWWFLVIGILSLITGFAILAKPVEGYVSLSILFSIIMACTGFSQIVFATSSRHYLKGWGWTLASGIIDFALGIFLMIYPTVTMATLPFFIGFYLLFRGFYLIGASIDLNVLGMPGWGWVLTGGIIATVLGFLTIYHPAAGALGIIAYSGSAFIITGISSVILAFQLKGAKTDIEKFNRELKAGIRTGTHKEYHEQH